jgi:hypothetical protein
VKYCIHCGFVGEPALNAPGMLAMEIGLWFLFVVPGVVYSIWRRSARYQHCANCGHAGLVTADSAVAMEAFRKRSPNLSLKPWACLACGQPIFRGGLLCPSCARAAQHKAAPSRV